jgi:hypothetical protein
MKNILLLSFASVIVAFSSCRKGDLSPVSKSIGQDFAATGGQDSITVISNIIRFKDDPTVILPFYYSTDFTYAGKRLTVAHTRTISQGITSQPLPQSTNTFIYNDNQVLTGSNIVLAQSFPVPDWAIERAAITCSNGRITKITFYRFDQTIANEYTLTYKSGLLQFICDPNSVMIMYTYDSTGNNIKQCIEEYENGKPTGKMTVVTSTSFDQHKNFQKALPLWVYFKCFDMAEAVYPYDINFVDLQQSFTNTPGLNNPLNMVTNGSSAAITYQYNSAGYPEMIRYPNISDAWKYTYIKVK